MRNVLFFSTLLMASLNSSAQNTTDSSNKHQEYKILHGKLELVSKNVDTIRVEMAGLKKVVTGDERICASCKINPWQWVLIFSPIWLFAIIWFALRKKLKEFSLRSALKETEFRKRTIPNPEYSAEKLLSLSGNSILTAHLNTLLPPTIEVTDPSEDGKDSSSRYISLITSAIAWVVALCLSCFYLYQYMASGSAPKLDGLSTVLITLGIGVVPYAFNKVSKAINS